MQPKKNILYVLLIIFLSISYTVSSEEDSTSSCISSINTQKKHHILYLIKTQKLEKAIDAYKDYITIYKKHDFEILEQIGLILLDLGMKSSDMETQLVSLYGASLANVEIILDLCEQGSTSPHPTTQIISVQMAGNIQDDRADQILTKALSSQFLGIRMEAAFSLAQKKHKSAVGYIESLMHKLPPFFHSFFSEMYAMVGSNDANRMLKKLMHDPILFNRVSAFLAAAKFGRDDFISDIRNAATHKNPAEQEACASALGFLGDSYSIDILKNMIQSQDEEVKVAASRALLFLGQNEALVELESLAKKKNLFAITSLSLNEKKSPILYELLQDSDKLVKYNAALTLLKKKDPVCLPLIKEILNTKKNDVGFLPHFSQGRSLIYFKMLPSLSIHAKKEKNSDLIAHNLAFRQQVLLDTLELDHSYFLNIADHIFHNNLNDLIPTSIELLCNIGGDEVINFLKKYAEKAGAPFIRNFCYLGLYRLQADEFYFEHLLSWMKANYKTEMIRFKPIIAKSKAEANLQYELSPEESSALLIGIYLLISHKQSETSIDLLLEGIKLGYPKNRGLMAGLLLKTIE